MQECFVKYPELYGRDDDELDESKFEDVELESKKGNDKKDDKTGSDEGSSVRSESSGAVGNEVDKSKSSSWPLAPGIC